MGLRLPLVPFAVVLGLGACGDDLPTEFGTESSPTGAASLGPSGSSSSTTGEPGPPRVVDIGRDVLVLREGESVVLTAVVFDPDDDVVSGELLGPGEPELYGTFTSHPSDRWRATVSWEQVRERWSLSFEQRAELPFRARFVDAQGHEVTESTTVPAVCSGLIDTACDGVCVDVQLDDAHCDGCDQACLVGPDLTGAPPSGGCEGGACQPWWSGCFVPGAAEGQTCAEHCATLGARCADDGCWGPLDPRVVMAYSEAGACRRDVAVRPTAHACGADLGALEPAVAMRCCCR